MQTGQGRRPGPALGALDDVAQILLRSWPITLQNPQRRPIGPGIVEQRPSTAVGRQVPRILRPLGSPGQVPDRQAGCRQQTTHGDRARRVADLPAHRGRGRPVKKTEPVADRTGQDQNEPELRFGQQRCVEHTDGPRRVGRAVQQSGCAREVSLVDAGQGAVDAVDDAQPHRLRVASQ
jgi:hypothetical protein